MSGEKLNKAKNLFELSEEKVLFVNEAKQLLEEVGQLYDWDYGLFVVEHDVFHDDVKLFYAEGFDNEVDPALYEELYNRWLRPAPQKV